MSTDGDPVRLLAPESGASEALREVLRAAAADHPTAALVERMSARLSPLLEGPRPTPWPSGVKVGLSVGSVAALAGLALVWWNLETAPVQGPPAAPPVLQAPPVARPPAPPPPLDPRATDRALATPPAVPSGADLTPRRRPRSAPVRPAAAPADPTPLPAPPSPGDEMTVLGAAHQALRAGRPERALTLTVDHEHRFADGVLAEEREAIAIEALVRLGRPAVAAERLATFVGRYPTSGYRERLERLVAELGLDQADLRARGRRSGGAP